MYLFREHPERPDRIKRIIETLKEKKLYDRCQELKSRFATENEIKLCHENSYIDNIKSVRDKTDDELKELSKNPNSVYYHSSTFDCALLATGSLLQVVDQVCTNKVNKNIVKNNNNKIEISYLIVSKWSWSNKTSRTSCV